MKKIFHPLILLNIFISVGIFGVFIYIFLKQFLMIKDFFTLDKNVVFQEYKLSEDIDNRIQKLEKELEKFLSN